MKTQNITAKGTLGEMPMQSEPEYKRNTEAANAPQTQHTPAGCPGFTVADADMPITAESDLALIQILTAQRDELLAACKAGVEFCRYIIEDEASPSLEQCVDMREDFKAAIQKAEAAQ